MVVRLNEPQNKIALEYALIVAGLVLLASIASPEMGDGRLGQSAYDNIASAVGFSATIAPNEFNTLAQQLEQKEGELTSRERDLAAREQMLGEQYKEAISQNSRTTLFVVSGVTIFLLLLIFLNFYLDIIRQKNTPTINRKIHEGELQTRL